ncbi:MAG TPA: AAA family ATPase [Thermoanaerobaculia bacterium]|nr:AAA family ATPase [Thermoanaerobaculia bacterium]
MDPLSLRTSISPGAAASGASAAPYGASWDHLADELSWLDHRLHLRLLDRRREAADDPLEPWKGLVLSEQEVVRLLATGGARPAAGAALAPLASQAAAQTAAQSAAQTAAQAAAQSADGALRARVAAAAGALEQRIARRLEASARREPALALPRLARTFHLDPFEERCLLICLAPELDRKYEKLYAYLQDDVTRRRPTVGLVLELLCGSREEAHAARAAFEPRAALLAGRLLRCGDGADSLVPLLSRPLKLDDRIVGFLLGSEAIAPAVQELAERHLPGAGGEPTLAAADLRRRLGETVRARLARPDPGRLVVHLHGPYGAGKQALARGVCADLGLPLVAADLDRLLADPRPFEETLRLVAREAVLQPAALCLSGFHRLFGDEAAEAQQRDRVRIVFEALGAFSVLTWLIGERPWSPAGALPLDGFLDLELKPPEGAVARAVWEERLQGMVLDGDLDPGAFAGRFRLTPGQVRDAVALARDLARWRSPASGAVAAADLAAACRAQAGERLARVARKIEPRSGWGDIVLPPDQVAHLREICDQARHRDVVLGDWGFGQRLALGKGLNVLFSGPPGTGKTMAAEVIAGELALDLYKVDLSQVVSKYIGETEKNLDRVFAAAESSNAILFFDEADALFGKRSEVRDSHDRYANVEVSYLLQKMEEYEGVAILASNLRQHLDQAFLRRLGFMVHFPFPDEESRRRIWAGAWPAAAPLGADLDFGALAREFKLAGGNIKNVVLSAAFLAATEGGAVRQSHLLRATRREYQKMGKTLAANAGESAEAGEAVA